MRVVLPVVALGLTLSACGGGGGGGGAAAGKAGAPASPAAAAAPRIEAILPAEAPPGATIEILGEGFESPAVEVAGLPATVAFASPARIVATVPAGAFTGPVRVHSRGARSNAFVLRVPGSRPTAEAALSGPPGAGSPNGLSAREGPLARKAREYQETLERWHLVDGLIFETEFTDASFTTVAGYRDEGDSAIWTGTYLASQAWRYAATGGDPEALRAVREVVRGMKDLHDITGVRGLIGRCFLRNSIQMIGPDPDHHDGTGRFAGFRWQGDVSRDQYVGYVLGLSLAHDLVPDPVVRADCASLLAAIGDHLIRHGGRIVDVDGRPTTHGDLFVEVQGAAIPQPLHAMLAIAWLRAAERATGDPKYGRFAETFIYGRGYGFLIEQGMQLELYALTKWFNLNLGFSGMFTLLRLEQDAWARERWQGALENRMWNVSLSFQGIRIQQPVKEQLNTWFSFLHGAMADRGPDWVSIHEGIWQLQNFYGAPNRGVTVDGTALVTPDPIAAIFGEDMAMEPTPVQLRPRDAFVWQRSPYAFKVRGNPLHQYHGVDYLAPYWAGRYYGYIAPDM